MEDVPQDEHTLSGLPIEDYCDPTTYHEHIKDQYVLFSNLANEHFARVNVLNRFFLTINTAFAYGIVWLLNNSEYLGYFSTLLIMIISIPICIIWHSSLKSASIQSSVKMEILQEIESFLPIKPFYYEWYSKLQQGNRYSRIQHTIQYIPLIFISVYLLISVWIIFLLA